MAPGPGKHPERQPASSRRHRDFLSRRTATASPAPTKLPTANSWRHSILPPKNLLQFPPTTPAPLANWEFDGYASPTILLRLRKRPPTPKPHSSTCQPQIVQLMPFSCAGSVPPGHAQDLGSPMARIRSGRFRLPKIRTTPKGGHWPDSHTGRRASQRAFGGGEGCHFQIVHSNSSRPIKKPDGVAKTGRKLGFNQK